MKTRMEKIKFIGWFIVFYAILLTIGLKLIGNTLIRLDISIIKSIFGNIINYNSFIFVSECSGVVGVSAYLSIVLALVVVKYKIDWRWVIGSIVLLSIWNIIRISIVLYSEKASFQLASFLHVTLWFVTGVIIVLLAIKSLKKKKKK